MFYANARIDIEDITQEERKRGTFHHKTPARRKPPSGRVTTWFGVATPLDPRYPSDRLHQRSIPLLLFIHVTTTLSTYAVFLIDKGPESTLANQFFRAKAYSHLFLLRHFLEVEYNKSKKVINRINKNSYRYISIAVSDL